MFNLKEIYNFTANLTGENGPKTEGHGLESLLFPNLNLNDPSLSVDPQIAIIKCRNTYTCTAIRNTPSSTELRTSE